MIEKITNQNQIARHKLAEKINELVDAINALIKENNIHEEQIDELQMKVEPAHPTATTKPADPYAEQRKWIGKLCKVYDYSDSVHYAILENIWDNSDYCYGTLVGDYQHCELVKPDDDIIYKGE